jgi:prepilin-type N-terminal cleavage/methylation domain-containing protein
MKVGRGQWAAGHPEGTRRRETASGFIHPSAKAGNKLPAPKRLSGFTLIELLVTIAIISILAGITLGAIRYARHAAAEAKTKATIAKLNDLVMRRYESYRTRRVPITIPQSIQQSTTYPRQAALLRYCALLDLMRMEMPERTYDIINGPLGLGQLTNPWTARPAFSQMFYQKYTQNNPKMNYVAAKYLYMWISMTYPEAMEQFDQNEIADLDRDGWPVFIDGWGNPIMFLRWAPGFLPSIDPKTNCDTEVQTGDAINDHDPFDSRRICPSNYRLIPLIYSPGPDQAGHDPKNDKKYGIMATSQNPDGTEYNAYYGVDPSVNTIDDLNPYAKLPTVYGDILVGSPSKNPSDPAVNRLDNIHNHRIEQQ